MKRLDVRTILGAGLLVFGCLLFLEKLGFLHGAGSLFWGLVLLAGAGYFFYVYFIDRRSRVWAIFPALVLFGMGAGALLPPALAGWGGALFLGAIGLAFWVLYFGDRSRWWGIIPGGVLITLAVISVLDHISSMDTGGIFYLGLAITFLLVALLPNPVARMQWAYIPAGILAAMGILRGSALTTGLVGYVWPAVLIITGALIVFSFFYHRE